MKAYLAIKYHSDLKNKQLIENLSEILKEVGHETCVIARDKENWGKNEVKRKPTPLVDTPVACCALRAWSVFSDPAYSN